MHKRPDLWMSRMADTATTSICGFFSSNCFSLYGDNTTKIHNALLNKKTLQHQLDATAFYIIRYYVDNKSFGTILNDSLMNQLKLPKALLLFTTA
jgi:hypothetical protein